MSITAGPASGIVNSGSQPPQQAPLYVSRIWRTQDGLPENRIRAIAQTPDGYLWIGTSGGLARFDGVRFVVYARFNTPSMADDNIRALAVAKDGSVWAATDGGGLLHYKDGHFRSFGPSDGLTNEFVTSVLEDRRGDVWAGTNRGLFRLHGERFERVDTELHLANIAFFGLYEDRGGRVFAGGPGGVFRIENRKLIRHDMKNEVYQIGGASDGSLWLGTSHGLRITGNVKEGSTRFQTRKMIGAIQEDHAGNMWVGTIGDGLSLVQEGRETAFRAPIALPNDSISAILEDREQNIWVGTADGLVRMSAADVGLLNSGDGLADENVSTVYCDHHGSIWLTTVTGGIFRYANGRIEGVPLPAGTESLRIRGTYEDRAGAFWFGTDNQGVVRVANGSATRFTMAEGLRNNGIQAFFEDRRTICGSARRAGSADGTARSSRIIICRTASRTGGFARLRKITTETCWLVRTAESIVFKTANSCRTQRSRGSAAIGYGPFFRTAPDTLWIGTRGAGLVRVRNGKASRITTREGLLSNTIFQVIGDGGGRLWMSGPLGLSSASFVDLNSAADGRLDSVAVLSYGTGDGLESTQMNGGVQPSGCMAPDGELWFPSVKGAVHFKPARPRMSHPSPVRVESVLIDDRIIPATGDVVIGPGRRRVEIDFTACNLRAPERVTFRYKLDGFDGQWIAPMSHRAAYYDNLPPGRYRFRVIARDGSPAGGSSEAGVFLAVLPQFYQTLWFYALAFAATGVLAAGVLLFQERQARVRYNLRLAERTRIAREMHDTVVQGCVGVSTLIEAAVGSAGSDQHQMLECLDNARIHLRLTLDEARQALSDLRHDSFEKGLSGALSELAQRGEC